MKRTFLQIVFMISSCVTILAQSDSAFADGNMLYSEGNYEEAISKYQDILDDGMESAELYYNMGNAAFRSNKIGYSVVYYRKALKADPGFEPAAQNLKYVSLYLEDKLESVPELFLKRWKSQFFNIFPLEVWSFISIALFVLTLICLLLYVFGSFMWVKKTGFYLGIISLLIMVLSLSAAVNHHKNVKHPDKAVIISPSVVVKSSPSDSGTDLFVLHEGTDLITDDKVGEWIEIKIIDGRVGWVRSKTIEII